MEYLERQGGNWEGEIGKECLSQNFCVLGFGNLKECWGGFEEVKGT